jgi:predicted TIM-barrel fold metal-dependent hydrolase
MSNTTTVPRDTSGGEHAVADLASEERPGRQRTETGVLDVDQHIFEARTAWLDNIDPGARDDALRIEDDEHGWPWLCWRGAQLSPVEVQHPGRPELIGRDRRAMADGEPAPQRYEDVLPPAYGHPRERLASLDRMGVERCVLFPNFGLLYESRLAADRPALCANLRAFNRWMAAEAALGDGRLFGVGHLTLLDVSWAVEEVHHLSNAGIRLAMTAPSTVAGKPLSHPDFHPVWAAMSDAGVAPVFHVGNFRSPLDPSWYACDPQSDEHLMESVMLGVAPAVALADLIIHGTLERFPRLRIGVVELTAGWVPRFLVQLDGAWDFYAARHTGPMTALPLRPAEYFRRQVRVAALPYENPAHLIDLVGPDVFMFGSDWPHAEGMPDPGASAAAAAVPEGPARHAFLCGNAEWLLGL